MKKGESKVLSGLFALLLAAGCANESGDGVTPPQTKQIGQSNGNLTVFLDAMGNPLMPTTATAAATAWDVGGKLKLAISVAGFPASRDFGVHLHKDACDVGKAGGHYQHNVAPTMMDVNTPAYANTMNEAWMDFTTRADGTGTAETTQDWLPRAMGAKAIIIHAMRTDVNGRAGDKLACLPMALP
jgi:hypothetical protein